MRGRIHLLEHGIHCADNPSNAHRACNRPAVDGGDRPLKLLLLFGTLDGVLHAIHRPEPTAAPHSRRSAVRAPPAPRVIPSRTS